jgi:hypothetical protein
MFLGVVAEVKLPRPEAGQTPGAAQALGAADDCAFALGVAGLAHDTLDFLAGFLVDLAICRLLV